MFKKDDVVINKKGQVCKIIDVTKINGGVGDRNYYVLISCFSNSTDKSYIPCENESMLRKPIDKDEIEKILGKIKDIKPIWYVNPKIRKTEFKEMYDTGDPIKIFTLIKSFEAKKAELINEKKTLSFTDESFLKEIKRNLYNEFAVSLGKTPEEVEMLIRSYLN